MTSAAAGRLHLVPVPIAGAPAPEGPDQGARTSWTPDSVQQALPEAAIDQVRRSHYFLVENARTARAFLKAAGHGTPLASLDIVEIGHQPAAALLDQWLAPLIGREGLDPVDAVVLSEAGCPGIADPGSSLVARAHELGIRVLPWIGPSSIVLALMGAGMNGQQFRFLGYLPQERAALRERLTALEGDARRGETQIFIETPYRNERLLEALLTHCAADLRLCLAIGLTGAEAFLQTRSIAQWRALASGQRPKLHRRPAVFLLHGAPAVPGAHKPRG
jgi:16S rRNA (cytidine1402-2'-O)-methyltransferase